MGRAGGGGRFKLSCRDLLVDSRDLSWGAAGGPPSFIPHFSHEIGRAEMGVLRFIKGIVGMVHIDRTKIDARMGLCRRNWGKTHRRESWFSNTLVLPGMNIYEALKIDDPKKLDKDYTFDLRGRHLEGAVFNGAKLTKVDLTSAHLKEVSLDNARLRGAWLDEAQLQGASLRGVELQGAYLRQAQLQGAALGAAQLQGASLRDAQLQGATFVSFYAVYTEPEPHKEPAGGQTSGSGSRRGAASGSGSDRVQLQGASLHDAQLQGASLREAELQGASLDKSNLTAADAKAAFLWRTDFSSVELNTASAQAPNWFGKSGAIFSEEPGNIFTTRYFSLFLPGEAKRWRENDYLELKKLIEHDVPAGYLRIKALERIQILDCNNKRKDLPRLAILKPRCRHRLPIAKKDRESGRKHRATHAKALEATP